MCWERGAESVVSSEGASTLPTFWCPLAGADRSPSPWWLGLLEGNAGVGIPPASVSRVSPRVCSRGNEGTGATSPRRHGLSSAAADAFSAASPRLAPVGCQLLHKQGRLKTCPGSGPGICCHQPRTAAGKARPELRARSIFEAEASKPRGLGGNTCRSPFLEGERIQSPHPKMNTSNSFNASLKTN